MEISANFGEHSYMFAIPCYDGKLQAETTLSCLSTSGKLTSAGVKHCFNLIRGSALIDTVRNEICARFLLDTECDTLVCIDADIEFEWEAMERLLVFSSHYPIVAGAYPSRTEPIKFVVNAMENPTTLNEHGLIRIKGLGMGFVAIQRSALEQMKPHVETYFDKVANREIWQFFKTGTINPENREYVGEDIYFFKKAVECGIQPFLDPGISLKHHGTKAYDAKISDYIDQLLGDKHGVQTH